MAVADCLLLLDLDGVVVYEAGPPVVPERGLFSLHDGIEAALGQLGMPVVVLTHRSRREAAVILRSAGLAPEALGGPGALGGIIAAEDLFLQAVRGGHFARLGRHGLAKSFALPHVERVYGVDRSRVAIIDDRRLNLDDLLAHGVGAALHAPSAVAPDGLGLVTFDLACAVAALRRFQAGAPEAGGLVSLPPRTRAFASWQASGFSTRAVERHAFNRLRRAGNRLRRAAFRLRLGQPPHPSSPGRGGGS